MQARQYEILLFDLIAESAYGTLFVFFGKISLVSLCELVFCQPVYHRLWHWIGYVFVKLQELFVLYWVFSIA